MKKNTTKLILIFAGVLAALVFLYVLLFVRKSDTQESPQQAQFCGGIANVPCPAGYRCRLDGDYPDAGGVCVR